MNTTTSSTSLGTVHIKRVPVCVAAALMGKTDQYIRIRMQRGLISIGSAAKISPSRYDYYISPKLFMEYTGATEEAIVREMVAQGKERYLYE